MKGTLGVSELIALQLLLSTGARTPERFPQAQDRGIKARTRVYMKKLLAQ